MDLFWCSSCLTMSTRPRITFDKNQQCNACQWKEEKKKIDWNERKEYLKNLLNEAKNINPINSCLVPVSGGKDGSHVSYNLKHVYNSNILSVTVNPPLQTSIGKENLRNYNNSGYNLLSIDPNPIAMQKLNKAGFIEWGFPYFGWLVGIQSAVLRTAISFKIPLIFYGEDGEVEYGGSKETKNEYFHDINYMKEVYFEGGYEKIILNSGLSQNELYFFLFPEESDFSKNQLKVTWWSHFEDWDPYKNYLTAKKYCGLKEFKGNNVGTFTNFAQNDQFLYALHTYIMYLKFGFGRANQDACIEIRRGAMSREQAVNLVNLYDNAYPYEYLKKYLKYFEMTKNEFDKIIDKWANKDLFEKKDNIWVPKFVVK